MNVDVKHIGIVLFDDVEELDAVGPRANRLRTQSLGGCPSVTASPASTE